VKRRDIHRLARRHLVPEFGGDVHDGMLILTRRPEDLILRGFVFEGSDFDRSVLRVTAFLLPLYVPTDNVHMTFGNRLGGPANFWTFAGVDEDVAMESIREHVRDEGMKFLDRARTPGGFADWLSRKSADSANPNVHEAIAYSLVLDGRTDEAHRSLAQARRRIAEAGAEARSLDLDPTGSRPRADRIDAVERALAASPRQAIDLLREWAEQTAARIGVAGSAHP
jgi:hypothetical protein